MDGAVYTHNVVQTDFTKKYVEKYGNDFQIAYAANAYVFATLIKDLLASNIELKDGTKLLDYFKKIKGGDSVMGQYAVINTPHNGTYYKFPIAVKKIMGDKIEVLQ